MGVGEWEGQNGSSEFFFLFHFLCCTVELVQPRTCVASSALVGFHILSTLRFNRCCGWIINKLLCLVEKKKKRFDLTRNVANYFCKCLKIFRVKIKKNYLSQPVNLFLMQYSLLPTEKEHTKVNWSFHQKSGNFPPIMTESDYPETLGTNFPTKQFLKNAQTWARAFSTLRLAPGIQLLGGHWANPPKFYIYCCVHPRCANAPLDKCIAGQKNIRNPHFPEKIWISA